MKITRERQVKAFLHQEDGSNLIEFALVAPVIFLMIFALIEFGLITFSMTALESATSSVARQARVFDDGGGGNLIQTIRDEIRQRTNGLINVNDVIITTDLRDYGVIPKPETCLSPVPVPAGTCPIGVPFEDTNGNGVFDGTLPDLALGGPSDLIRLNVHYPWRVLTPLVGPIVAPQGEFVITSTTFVKNEP